MSALTSRWKIVVPVLLVALGAAYMFVLKPKPVEAKKKVDGAVYVLPKEFVVNLKDDRFAKFTVALVLPALPVAAEGEGGAPPPDGFGLLPEEAAVRDLITDEITNDSAKDLISGSGRRALKRRLLAAINKKTDVDARAVLLTDVAVQ